jgi:hypothetical protein
MLRPTATLYLQRAPAESDGKATPSPSSTAIPAIKLTAPTNRGPAGFPVRASVEADSKEGNGLAYLRLRIPELTSAEVASIPVGGLVRLDAGYSTGGPALPPERPIFFGVLQAPRMSREGSTNMVEVSAVSRPTGLLAQRVAYTAKEQVIGEVIEAMCSILHLPPPLLPREFYLLDKNLDGTINLDLASARKPLLLGTQEVPYTPQKSFMEEVSDHVATVSHLSGKTFSQVPNIQDPYQLRVVDMARQEFGLLRVNLDAPHIIDANPEYEEAAGQTTTYDGSSDETPILDSRLNYVAKFSVTQAFDPRISLGLAIAFTSTDYGAGRFIVEHLEHNLQPDSPWTTAYSGRLLFGDRLAVSPVAEAATGGGG